MWYNTIMKTVKISDEIHKKLKVYAAENDYSIAYLIEDAVSVYFDPITDTKDFPAKKIISGKLPESYDPELVQKNLKEYPGPVIIKGAIGLTKKRGELRGDDYE